MRVNNVQKIWQEGGAVVNGWLAIPNSFAAEVMGGCGWDSVTIDLQHGLSDFSDTVQMLQALSTTPVTPLTRVPTLEPGIIGRLLDAGSYGIICPMINTPEQCAQLVSYCKYAPDGVRSFGPIRAAIYGGPDYLDKANETVQAIAMVETAEALANVDAIVATPGLDGIYVGPSDLALSLGERPQMDTDNPVVTEAMATILAAAKRAGVPAGLHCLGPEYALQKIREGFQFVSIANDTRILTAAAQDQIATIRQGLAD